MQKETLVTTANFAIHFCVANVDFVADSALTVMSNSCQLWCIISHNFFNWLFANGFSTKVHIEGFVKLENSQENFEIFEKEAG